MYSKLNIPLKRYRLLTSLLNQDKEVYTGYSKGTMRFMVNFDNLVRTLEINPDLYHKPIVELEDYGFMVRGNNIFFDAGVKAGINSFIVDVNIKTLDDRHMSQFQLMDYTPEISKFRTVLIFFMDYTVLLSRLFNSFSIFSDEINGILSREGFGEKAFFEAVDYDTIVFKVIRGEFNHDEPFFCAKEILSKFGKIRSINGLISKQ